MKHWVTVLMLALSQCHPAAAGECYRSCVTSPEGVTLIQFFEGFSPFVYKDSAGLDTIGYGHLIVAGERIEQPLLGDAADALLKTDLRRTERGLNRGLARPLAQHRFDAVASFAFNVGVAACTGSTAFRYVNADRHADVPAQLNRWVYAGGKVVRGLQVRRAAEGRLYAR